MYAPKEYPADGLQLSSLSCFGLANHSVSGHMSYNPLHYRPPSFSSVSAQLPTMVTNLDLPGEHTLTTSSTSSLIETFHKVDTMGVL